MSTQAASSQTHSRLPQPRTSIRPEQRSVTPSLHSSLQPQLDDLVQRNRTLEHAVHKLSTELGVEKTRSQDAVSAIQKRWQEDQQTWREGCDVLQECHRIVRMRDAADLERERTYALKLEEEARKKELAALQRDFRITTFQGRERDLESRVEELEEERDTLLWERDSALERHKKVLAKAMGLVGERERSATAKDEAITELQDEISTLRESHASLEANAEASRFQLERATLQYETTQTKNEELIRIHDELKRTNADIKRQLDKWQSFEQKGEAEVDAQRTRRVEAENQLKELKDTLESERKEFEKAQRKIEKYKTAMEEWKATALEYESEKEASNKQVAKLEKQLSKLKQDLEVERARVAPVVAHVPQVELPSEDEDAERSPKTPAVGRKPPSRARKGTTAPSGSKPKEDPKPRSTGRKTRPRTPPIENVIVPESVSSDSSDNEEPQKGKGKSKDKGKQRAEAETVEVANIPENKPKAKRKTKTGPPMESEYELVEDGEEKPSEPKNRKRGRGEGVGQQSEKPVKTRKTRAGSVQPRAKTDEVEIVEDPNPPEEEPQKRKKRKINIFATGQSTNWDFLPQPTGTAFDIPTILSPVKEAEAVPNRHTSGSVFGSIGSILTSTFSSKR